MVYSYFITCVSLKYFDKNGVKFDQWCNYHTKLRSQKTFSNLVNTIIFHNHDVFYKLKFIESKPLNIKNEMVCKAICNKFLARMKG